MTIRKGKAGDAGRPSPGSEADGRVRRPEAAGRAPNRASPAASGGPAADPAKPKGPAPKAKTPPEPKVSEAVAHAVKMGYDVIAQNIRQGREAAERFRQGEYSLRDAPGDLEVASLRLLQLARELSTTTFDVCERLLKELGAQVALQFDLRGPAVGRHGVRHRAGRRGVHHVRQRRPRHLGSSIVSTPSGIGSSLAWTRPE